MDVWPLCPYCSLLGLGRSTKDRFGMVWECLYLIERINGFVNVLVYI